MKYVKIKKINKSENESVYHLTVEKNRNFFANKLCVHNCDYLGEIKVILINLSGDDYQINHGDRIAQGVFNNVAGPNITDLIEIDEITKETKRGDGGFNSTGYN